jgi:hypothetical protein
MTTDIKYIVVPDVHGRDFYESDMNTFIDGSDAHMIFLGDYLDPNGREKISEETAIEKFKKIIEMKKKYPDRITLLLGNHDLHYFNGATRGCRMSYLHYQEIHDLFIENFDLFQFVKFVTVEHNGKKKNIIFSHAGFGLHWLYAHSDKLGICDDEHFDLENTLKYFNFKDLSKWDWNEMWKDSEWLRYYGDVGSSRGGYGNHPSFMWADLSDHLFENDRVKNCIQVFGHTMQPVGQPVRFDNYYCLDCQQTFYINDRGTVFTNKMHTIRRNGEKYKEAYLAYLKKASMFFL